MWKSWFSTIFSRAFPRMANTSKHHFCLPFSYNTLCWKQTKDAILGKVLGKHWGQPTKVFIFCSFQFPPNGKNAKSGIVFLLEGDIFINYNSFKWIRSTWHTWCNVSRYSQIIYTVSEVLTYFITDFGWVIFFYKNKLCRKWCFVFLFCYHKKHTSTYRWSDYRILKDK